MSQLFAFISKFERLSEFSQRLSFFYISPEKKFIFQPFLSPRLFALEKIYHGKPIVFRNLVNTSSKIQILLQFKIL